METRVGKSTFVKNIVIAFDQHKPNPRELLKHISKILPLFVVIGVKQIAQKNDLPGSVPLQQLNEQLHVLVKN